MDTVFLSIKYFIIVIISITGKLFLTHCEYFIEPSKKRGEKRYGAKPKASVNKYAGVTKDYASKIRLKQ